MLFLGLDRRPASKARRQDQSGRLAELSSAQSSRTDSSSGTKAGLHEFQLLNGEDAARQIDIADVKAERSARPQAGGDEKTDERLERGAPQSRRRTQMVGGGHRSRVAKTPQPRGVERSAATLSTA